jgi:protein-disulfide isomerase
LSGLDWVRLAADRARGATAKAIAKVDELAKRLGVRGTPSFFINGRFLAGNQPIEAFEGVIDERLAAARALVQSGVRPGRVYEAVIAQGLEKATDAAEPGAGCGGEPSCKHPHDAAEAADVIEKIPTEGAPSRGPADAPITIVAFSDFECPYCSHALASLREVEKSHPGKVRVVFKQRPLPFHDHARLAAKASLAAAAQGRFWQYHDVLFANQKTLDRAGLEAHAREAGLDVARFSRDLDDPALEKRIDADIADAAALHVDGTPTFFVNGRRVVGAQGALAFEAAIAKK